MENQSEVKRPYRNVTFGTNGDIKIVQMESEEENFIINTSSERQS